MFQLTMQKNSRFIMTHFRVPMCTSISHTILLLTCSLCEVYQQSQTSSEFYQFKISYLHFYINNRVVSNYYVNQDSISLTCRFHVDSPFYLSISHEWRYKVTNLRNQWSNSVLEQWAVSMCCTEPHDRQCEKMSCIDVLYRASWRTVWENELYRCVVLSLMKDSMGKWAVWMYSTEPLEGEWDNNELYRCVVPSLMKESVGKYYILAIV